MSKAQSKQEKLLSAIPGENYPFRTLCFSSLRISDSFTALNVNRLIFCNLIVKVFSKHKSRSKIDLLFRILAMVLKYSQKLFRRSFCQLTLIHLSQTPKVVQKVTW